MECGEIDFAHILAKHQGRPLGLNFIRVYWEQMLRAVQAIHEEKIVHSDLKPANFLLIQVNPFPAFAHTAFPETAYTRSTRLFTTPFPELAYTRFPTFTDLGIIFLRFY